MRNRSRNLRRRPPRPAGVCRCHRTCRTGSGAPRSAAHVFTFSVRRGLRLSVRRGLRPLSQASRRGLWPASFGRGAGTTRWSAPSWRPMTPLCAAVTAVPRDVVGSGCGGCDSRHGEVAPRGCRIRTGPRSGGGERMPSADVCRVGFRGWGRADGWCRMGGECCRAWEARCADRVGDEHSNGGSRCRAVTRGACRCPGGRDRIVSATGCARGRLSQRTVRMRRLDGGCSGVLLACAALAAGLWKMPAKRRASWNIARLPDVDCGRPQ